MSYCLLCKKRQSFNIINEIKRLYCKTVNIKQPRCFEKGCALQSPSYNTVDELKGKYCRAHKLYGMDGVFFFSSIV